MDDASGVPLYVRVGDNEELLIGYIKRQITVAEIFRSIADELESGMESPDQRMQMSEDFFAVASADLSGR